MYAITYKDNEDIIYGYTCKTYDEVVEMVSRLKGFKQINILEYESEKDNA